MNKSTASQKKSSDHNTNEPGKVDEVISAVNSSRKTNTRPKGKNSTLEFYDHYPDENPEDTIDHITNTLVQIGSFQRAQEKRIASAMK